MDKAFEYVIKNKGIDTESSYPYTAVTGKVCKYKQDNVGATISSFKDIPTNSEAVNNPRVSTKIVSKIIQKIGKTCLLCGHSFFYSLINIGAAVVYILIS